MSEINTAPFNRNQNPMNAKQLEEFVAKLEEMKVKRIGFIMMPSLSGFDLYEIDENRLKIYLTSEILHQEKLKTNTKIPGKYDQ